MCTISSTTLQASPSDVFSSSSPSIRPSNSMSFSENLVMASFNSKALLMQSNTLFHRVFTGACNLKACNMRSVFAVRFTFCSHTHCTRPIRTNMHSTLENREAHKRQQRLQGTARERQSDPQKGSHITGPFPY